MKTPRECKGCHKKFAESAYETPIDISCRDCMLKIRRLNTKFDEMVASEVTGLRELDVFLTIWYGVFWTSSE